MTRKALLIGSQPNNLAGVLNDVEAMAKALRPRQFEIERLQTPNATRAAILNAYEKLIVDARPHDSTVIYYSGHGGLAQSPTGPDLQFIVPDDYTDSDETDFRGVTSVELSVLLARLTAVAPNATVILDCCHAAHLSRRLTNLRVKALLRPVHWPPNYEIVEHHITRLVEDGLPVQLRPLVSNPRGIRAVACAPTQSAWEATNRDGVEMGLFTDALTRALREADGLRLTWSTLIDAVRRHVQVFMTNQRPEVEGPADRQPFDTTELDPVNSLPVVSVGPDRVRLLGAPLLGVERGDEFAIMPARASGPQDGPPICIAVVDQLQPTSALAQLRTAATEPVIPMDARAHRTSLAARALPIGLPTAHPATPELIEAMSLRSLLRPAKPETDQNVTVEVIADADDQLTVRDDAGPLHPSYPSTSLGIGGIMSNLQRIAQATALRRLSGDPAWPLVHQVVIEWGRVRDGRPEPLPPSGAMLFSHADERVYFRLRNEGKQPMYVSLIAIGIAYRIEVLDSADPSGVLLAPDASYTYGWDENRQQLVGIPMTWPDGTDTATPRLETVVALISDNPVDVGPLRQRGVRGAGAESGGGQLLEHIASGKPRDLGAAPANQVRFDVLQIDFMVSPTAPPVAERATFLIDDRPELPVRMLSARGARAIRVAVRLGELCVHRNLGTRNADIRVDAIVRTGGTDGKPAHRTQTMRFNNIGDACRLPLDDVLIYLGPAQDFLDLAVWVSRDAPGSLALGDLLAQRLTGSITDLPYGLGTVAATVKTISTGAVLVNTAYEGLTAVAGQSIGLYRTSLLAEERFGIGRHERHSQDFSFTFSIEAMPDPDTSPTAHPASMTLEAARR